MLKSYLKTAMRFLLKNKTFSIINLFGLALGTLCCLYIVLYVADQYSYDKHLHDEANIYRVITNLGKPGEKHTMASCSPPIAPAIKKDFAEVAVFTRAIPTLSGNQHLLLYKDKSFYQKEALFVDSTFFEVFTYHFTNGNPAKVLSATNSVVIKKAVADKLFGTEDPIGKVIVMDDGDGKNNLVVTGVVDESLGKSHLQANLYIRMNPGGLGGDLLTNDRWIGNNFTYSYIKLNPHANPSGLEKKLPAFLLKYGGQQLRTSGIEKTLYLQPVTSIHTTAGYDAECGQPVSTAFLRILMLIAALIQIIACINFMNLSTARASKRAKEVGIRKVVGAGRKSLIVQFMGESFLMSVIGVLIALPLLILCLPLLNELVHADIHPSMLADSNIWFMLGGIVLLTGIFAGSYPAFYLSAFQAIRVIKGNFTNQVSAMGLRQSLVVFQFVLSIVLISGIIIIHSQLNYIKNKDLGFGKDQQLIFSFHTGDTKNKMPLFAGELRQLPEVKTVSLANNYPGVWAYNDWAVFLSGGNEATAIDQQNISSDEYSIKALGIQLVSGRDFHFHDSGATMINETLAKKLGLDPATAPGTRLFTSGTRQYTIAGVMKDFNYRSLRDAIYPFMIIYDPGRDDIDDMIVKVNSTNYSALLQKMESIWKKDLPSTPFEYSFLDEVVQRQYTADVTLSNIINSFTLMAIFISCLGLFGLAAFSAEQRSKEIGIRKVLGASIPGIIQLLSVDFLKLVAIAILIAAPIAWWAMNKWLQTFTYRTPLQWWMIALAGGLAICIALFTVSFQAVKAAFINPVRSLRSE
jgi:putative ABC transport system permease protein